jgi:gamma-glutamylcyclotransferase (GGCT)/AIG2-like uncharacterized protein YtfP
MAASAQSTASSAVSPPTLGGQVLYFAYGANLRREAFRQLCPGADWLGVARLEGHRFVIAWHGYASAQPDPESTVWGVLWLVPAARLPALDDFEAVGAGWYERVTRRVVTPAGPRVETMLYLAPRPDLGAPHSGYLDEVLAGAKENKLPAAYVSQLARLAG